MGRDGHAGRLRLAYIRQQLAEQLPVFGGANRLQGGSQEPGAVPVQHPSLRHVHRQVQSGLAAEGRQNAIGPLPRDDGVHHLDGQGLDVDHVRYALVRHDGCGVGS